MSQTSAKPAHTNELSKERSPYLLQHQHNPVDWRPWGEPAFAQARREDRPIFLSIGYSTCHWCHVMERESFENEAVARYLNDHFVSIKVDREERPDVDKIYMTFVQATTGQGGWPLSAFLTPDLKPFYGGTYFPPEPRQGRPSFLQLLQQLRELWRTRREELVHSALDIHERLAIYTRREIPEDVTLSHPILDQAAHFFKQEYDPQNGGFGSAPKFPRPTQPAFLLRHALRQKDEEAIRMVLHTCDRMASGGIYDQLGGGFARYSVDAYWLVPHFEKMLYDNAQLIHLYLDAHLISGEERFARVARETIDYVLRDMTHPEGGFYSAEDADSEGKEGKFYTWTQSELEAILSPEEFQVAQRYFGVSARGNFIDHSDPDPLPDQNVLSVANPKLSGEEAALLETAKRKMFEVRSRRARPHLDDKILASWNGLMLGALARAGIVLGEERYRNAADNNLRFLKNHLWDASSKTLYHRWREGERDQVQLLDAYSNLLSGVLDLYETALDPVQLEFAIELAEAMIARFYDPEQGGFWQSGPDSTDLILRIKEDYDGAEPSGNSVAVLALLKLSEITGRPDLREAAEKSLRLLSKRLKELPQAVPYLLQGLDFSLEESKRVVVAGAPEDPGTAQLLRAIHSVFQPYKVVLGNSGPVEAFARSLREKDGPLVYLCTGSSCQAPTRDAAEVRKLLKSTGVNS